jgi:hypothetical protein
MPVAKKLLNADGFQAGNVSQNRPAGKFRRRAGKKRRVFSNTSATGSSGTLISTYERPRVLPDFRQDSADYFARVARESRRLTGGMETPGVDRSRLHPPESAAQTNNCPCI